jgi:hypothetical protein
MTNAWTTITLSTARRLVSCVNVGKYALFYGGYTGSNGATTGGTISNLINIWNTETSTWSQNNLPTTRENVGVGSIGKYAIFAGGKTTGGTVVSTVDLLNVETTTWTQITLPSFARDSICVVSNGAYVLFIGGKSANSLTFYNNIDIWNSQNNTWTSQQFYFPIQGIKGVSVGQYIFFSGGYADTTGMEGYENGGKDYHAEYNIYQNNNQIVFNNRIGIGTSTPTKMLDVVGDAQISGDTRILGDLNVDSYMTSPSITTRILNISSTTNSTSSSTGALIVSGGVGVGQNLFVGGTASVAGLTRVTNTTGSTGSSTGALVVSGGVGIGQNLFVAGSMNVGSTGPITANVDLDVNGNMIIGDKASDNGNSSLILSGASTDPSLKSKPVLYHRAMVGLGIASDFAISFQVNGGSNTYTEGLRIHNNGYVGIGTTNPQVPLQISNMVLQSSGSGAFYIARTGVNESLNNITGTLNGTISTTAPNSVSTNISLNASGRIKSVGFIADSDSRIKKDITLIDDNESLNKLRLIEPKKYKYIDDIQRGSREVFGFIAQNAREFFPESVVLTKSVIPNIFQNKIYNQIDSQTIEIEQFQFNDVSFNVGDVIQLTDVEDNMIEGTIINLTSGKATISVEKAIKDPSNNNIIFVYGKEVSDFHALNKDFLFTINFSATQELDRMIDWHTKEIDRSVSGNATSVYGQSLLTKIKTLEQENTNLTSRIVSLETQLLNVLNRLQNAGL